MRLIKSELYKLKRISGLHLVYIFPLVMSGIAMFEMLRRIDVSPANQIIPPYSSFYFQFFGLFSPIVIALILFSFIQIENKNKMWESNYLLPISKGTIYVGKIFTSVLFALAYCVISYLTYIGQVLLCQAFYPEHLALNQDDNIVLIIFFSRMFLVLAFYSLLVIPVFIYIESAITALGIFMFFIFLSFFLMQKSWFTYYPFSYHLTVLTNFRSAYDIVKDKGAWITMIYAILAFLTGKFLFQNVSPRSSSN